MRLNISMIPNLPGARERLAYSPVSCLSRNCASSIVLLDDDLGSIVTAIRLGRRIYDNVRKAMGFIFAVHVPIAGLALLPLVLGLPIIFGPIHIAFLQMVIDPVCSLVFEAEMDEEDIMRRRPHAPNEPLFLAADRLEPAAGRGGLCTYCRHLRAGLPLGHAGAGGARARLLLAGRRDRQPDSG